MKNQALFLEKLKKLIAFKTEQAPAQENMPFGKELYDCLTWFNDLAKDFGLSVINYDNYMSEVVIGEGEEIGIIGHLDVVPAGTGWLSDPYTLTLRDGKYYARGITDDKAPLLMCLFAINELLEDGVKFNKKIRLFAGCNEESGWADVDYFKKNNSFPKWGFSPDGNFPVSYAEKGPNPVTFEFSFESKYFSEITGGRVVNAVCDYAYAVGKVDKTLIEKYNLTVNGDKIESFGKSAHGSHPELGKNAILPLLQYVKECGENIDGVIENLFEDKQGVTKIGNETGYATLSPNLINVKNGKLIITCDFRVPAKFTTADFIPLFEKVGVPFTMRKAREPLFVPKDSELVVKLNSAYESVTGEKLEPLSLCGATFASVFENGVAFGPELPNTDYHIHEPNEYMGADEIPLMYDIYLKAIKELVK